jgi:hypothetical protein
MGGRAVYGLCMAVCMAVYGQCDYSMYGQCDYSMYEQCVAGADGV